MKRDMEERNQTLELRSREIETLSTTLKCMEEQHEEDLRRDKERDHLLDSKAREIAFSNEEMKRLSDRINTLEQLKASLQIKIEEDLAAKEINQKLSEEVEKLRSQLEQSNSRFEASNAEKNDFKDERRLALEAELLSAKDECSSLRLKVTEESNKVENSERARIGVEEKFLQQSQQVKYLQIKIEEMSKAARVKEALLSEYNDKVKMLEEQLEDARRENDTVREAYLKSQQETSRGAADLQHSMAALEAAQEELRQSVAHEKSAAERALELTDENQKLKSELTDETRRGQEASESLKKAIELEKELRIRLEETKLSASAKEASDREERQELLATMSDNQKLKEQLEQMQKDVAISDTVRAQLKEAKRELANAKGQARKELEAVASENQKLKSQLEQMNQDSTVAETARVQLEEAKSKAVAVEQQVRQELEAAMSDNQTLKLQLEQMKKEATIGETARTQLDEAKRNAANVKEQVHQLSTTNADLQHQIQNIQQQLENETRRSKEIQEELRKSQTAQTEVKAQLEQTELSREELRQQLVELDGETTKIETKIAEIAKEKDEWKKQAEIKQKEMDILQKKVKEEQQRDLEYQERQDKNRRRLDQEAQTKKEELEAELKRAQQRHYEIEKQVERLQSDLEEASKNQKELQSEASTLAARNTQLERSLSETTGKFEEAQLRNDALLKETDKLRDTNEKQTSVAELEIKSLNEQLVEARSQLQDHKKDSDEKMQALKQQFDDLRNAGGQDQRESKELRETVEKLNEQIEKSKELSLIYKKDQSEKEKMQKEIRHLEEELNTSLRHQAEKEEEMKRMLQREVDRQRETGKNKRKRESDKEDVLSEENPKKRLYSSIRTTTSRDDTSRDEPSDDSRSGRQRGKARAPGRTRARGSSASKRRYSAPEYVAEQNDNSDEPISGTYYDYGDECSEHSGIITPRAGDESLVSAKNTDDEDESDSGAKTPTVIITQETEVKSSRRRKRPRSTSGNIVSTHEWPYLCPSPSYEPLKKVPSFLRVEVG